MTHISKHPGAISGALNNENDPSGKRRKAHAEHYYEEVRKRNAKIEIKTISSNTQICEKIVKTAYKHIFIEKHELINGYTYFAPDYDMAQSWQRLREGKYIQPHDITLLYHEAIEAYYMQQGYSYDQAHKKACEMGYNYQLELDMWSFN